MSEFVPRTRKPDNGNKYYISSRYAGKKGWNPCILGNPNTTYGRDQYLNVLPNCVAWVVGRYNEIIGEKNCDLLYIIGGNNNAKNLIQNAIKQGLEVGVEPRLGAVIVWADSQYGHVAVVEQMSKDGQRIRVSESGWNYNGVNHMWFADHAKGSDGNWLQGTDYNWMKGKYKFRGFIYNPAVEEKDDMTEEQVRKIAREEYAAIEQERKMLPASDYAKQSLAKAKEKGIMVGDGTGNQMPKAYVTREDLTVVMDRDGLL